MADLGTVTMSQGVPFGETLVAFSTQKTSRMVLFDGCSPKI